MSFERGVLKATISQLFGEICKDDSDGFKLQRQRRFLPEFIEGSNLPSLSDWINVFRMLLAWNPPVLNTLSY